MRTRLWLFVLPVLSACGSVTLPAAVQLADGTAMVGTTTAAVSGGHFSVATPDGSIKCGGTYDALDTRPTISVPVACTDGRHGNAVVTRAPDGMSGAGFVNVSDGSIARVAFGNNAGSILQPSAGTQVSDGAASPSAVAAGAFPPTPTQAAGSFGPGYGLANTDYRLASTGVGSGGSRVYTGNCPTPESLDTSGRRCGARSAASRPGGYDGYGSWASRSRSSYGGTTYVRGHYRNGRWVRGHTRRR